MPFSDSVELRSPRRTMTLLSSVVVVYHLPRKKSSIVSYRKSPLTRVSIQKEINSFINGECSILIATTLVWIASHNVGIHHARAIDQVSSKAPSRAVVQFFVPDVSEARQYGLEYSRYAIEAATKFCHMLVSSVWPNSQRILASRSRARARAQRSVARARTRTRTREFSSESMIPPHRIRNNASSIRFDSIRFDSIRFDSIRFDSSTSTKIRSGRKFVYA